MNRLRALLRLLAAAAVLVLIALCCIQCIDIYTIGSKMNAVSGTPIFTMPEVVHRLTEMAPCFSICIGIIFIALIFHATVKDDSKPRIPTPEYQLKQLKNRHVTLPEDAQKEELHRNTLRIAFGILISILLMPALVYLLDNSHFTDWNLEDVLADMLFHTLPWFIFALIAATIGSHLMRNSIQREIKVVSEASKPEHLPSRDTSVKQRSPLRYALFLMALLFIVHGILNGGLYDVLVKAINICTECIGLG